MFFSHHLHQPHGNEKSGPCLATGVLSECGGHVGSVCLVYLLFLFLFLILEFLFLSCIKGLSVKSPLLIKHITSHPIFHERAGVAIFNLNMNDFRCRSLPLPIGANELDVWNIFLKIAYFCVAK